MRGPSRPVALVVRTLPGAEEVAAALEGIGWRAVPAPVLSVRPTGEGPPALEGFQAMLVTSAAAARILGAKAAARDVPVLAAGDRTARACAEAGFSDVRSAQGDAEDLRRLAEATLDPARGPLLHASGRDTARDIASALEGGGFRVERAVLYEADPVDALPCAARAALGGGAECALLFSARGAGAFTRLVREAGLDPALSGLLAACMSPRVADALDPGAWREIRTASRPDAGALIAALPAVEGLGGGAASPGVS